MGGRALGAKTRTIPHHGSEGPLSIQADSLEQRCGQNKPDSQSECRYGQTETDFVTTGQYTPCLIQVD
jgi:hypothetical protein